MIERRLLRGLEVRAEDTNDGHTVLLHLITPGRVDDYGSLWDARSLDKGLETRMPTLAWGHQMTDLIGRPIDFRTSDQGPDVRFLLDDFDAVPRARQAWAQLQPVEFEGRTLPPTIQDCSIGFERVSGGTEAPTEAMRREHRGIREFVREAWAREASLVLKGAVDGAKAVALRSADGALATVSEDLVVDLAKRVAAKELTFEEAKAALDLASGTQTTPTAATTTETETTEELDDADVAEAEQALDEALGALR